LHAQLTYIWPCPFLDRIEQCGAALLRYSDITEKVVVRRCMGGRGRIVNYSQQRR
jgi:hypothetical protein